MKYLKKFESYVELKKTNNFIVNKIVYKDSDISEIIFKKGSIKFEDDSGSYQLLSVVDAPIIQKGDTVYFKYLNSETGEGDDTSAVKLLTGLSKISINFKEYDCQIQTEDKSETQAVLQTEF